MFQAFYLNKQNEAMGLCVISDGKVFICFTDLLIYL